MRPFLKVQRCEKATAKDRLCFPILLVAYLPSKNLADCLDSVYFEYFARCFETKRYLWALH